MKKKVLAVLLSIGLTFSSVSAYAHSGRTDAAGGHHDYNNVSGLGSYHYHHGYGPHLHPNGVCPYESFSYETSTYNYVTPSPKATSKYLGTATKSNMTVYINGNSIPALDFNGETYIAIESLNSYGYDVTWNSEIRSITATRNIYKKFSYDNRLSSSNSFSVYDSDIKAYFYNGDIDAFVEVPSYNVSGNTIINITNLGTRDYYAPTNLVNIYI